MNKKRTSINDVARRAGVSISTVSRIINNTAYPVSAELRRKVLQAVEALHYSPSIAAQGLRRGSSNVVGLIVRDIADHYFGDIARGVTERAMQLGCLAFVCNTGRNPESEMRYHELLWQHRVQGIILGGGGMDTPEYRRILGRQLQRCEQYGLRLVGLGPQGLGMPAVTVDYAQVARTITERLLAAGHRDIAFITGSRQVFTSQEHIAGYRAPLESRGVAPQETLVLYGDFTEQAGYERCRHLLSGGRRFTALCAGSDTIAIGVLHALNEAGLRVPDDVSVIGVGDIPPARYMAPPLTTVRIPRYEMGVRAVEIATGEVPVPDHPVMLSPELVERRSVRRI